MSDLMGPDGSGRGPLEEFFARLYGGTPAGSRRLDIGRLMSRAARQVVGEAAQAAAEWHNRDLDTEHVLWALAGELPGRELLTAAGVDADALRDEIADRWRGRDGDGLPPALTPGAKRVLLDALQISRALSSSWIGPEHLLLALTANRDTGAGALLGDRGITPESLERAAATGRTPRPGEPVAEHSATPTLDRYGTDVTGLARDGRLDPVVGRADVIEQTVEVLSRRTKNNPVLIGEAGVGKTAIVEGIAQRIVEGDVPDTLARRRVVQLDLAGLVAGTRYRGDFEERAKAVIDEIRAHGDHLVVFIDELHTVVGTGSGAEGTMDVGNLLKPALARGELHVVGATTLDEYRRHVESDAALERRFQPVLVPEPSVPDTVLILQALRDRYEAHHQVRFTDEALQAAAELSARYVADRHLPDKAIDLIDQTGARVRLRSRAPSADLQALEDRLMDLVREKDEAVAHERYEQAVELRDRITTATDELERARSGGAAPTDVVGAGDVADVVSRATGIPVRQLTTEERQRLRGLEDELHRRVVGQDEAVSAVAEAVRRARSGLGDPDRPVGSFLFLGPTGVGKTELSLALAEALFGDESRTVRFDMSEFQERHTVSRLLGAPPGYVGYGEAGGLTEAVRRRPYSVVLLDEIEKAHPDVFNVLLQLLDDGRLTDGQGRTVDFRNTVVIMTSNLGSELITGEAGGIGFVTPSASEAEHALQDRLRPRLRETFRPEFLNRIDEIVVFRRLEREQLRAITVMLLDETRRRLAAMDVELELTDEAVDRLADHGYEPDFGARPLKRTLQREVDNRMSDLLLAGRLTAGTRARVSVGEHGLEVDVAAPLRR